MIAVDGRHHAEQRITEVIYLTIVTH